MSIQRAVKFALPSLPMAQWFFVIAALVVLTTLIQEWFPAASEWLRWQPNAVAAEPWRSVTGHLAHLSVTHAALNLVAWLLVWQLFKPDWQRGDAWLMLISLPLAGLLLGLSQLDWYVGLSGVLHGWFLLGAIRAYSSQRGLALIMMIGLLLKLWWEPNNPLANAEVELIGGSVAYVSHQLGLIAILILLVLQFACLRLSGRVRV